MVVICTCPDFFILLLLCLLPFLANKRCIHKNEEKKTRKTHNRYTTRGAFMPLWDELLNVIFVPVIIFTSNWTPCHRDIWTGVTRSHYSHKNVINFHWNDFAVFICSLGPRKSSGRRWPGAQARRRQSICGDINRTIHHRDVLYHDAIMQQVTARHATRHTTVQSRISSEHWSSYWLPINGSSVAASHAKQLTYVYREPVTGPRSARNVHWQSLWLADMWHD